MELPRLVVPWTKGDVLPQIAGCIEGFDLTGYTLKLTVARPTTALEIEATIDAPTTGAFRFIWGTDDLVVGVGQEALIRLYNSDDESLTIARFVIDVGEVPGGEVA